MNIIELEGTEQELRTRAAACLTKGQPFGVAQWSQDPLLSPLLSSSEAVVPPCVSVVIPSDLIDLEGALRWKAASGVLEVLFLYNGTDDPPQHPDIRVIQVEWSGHGSTRQSAVELCRGRFIFFTVDDALPLSGIISELLSAFELLSCDALVARQIPWPNASAAVRERIASWTPYSKNPYRFSQADHVGTLYLREDLLREPLPSVDIAEDLIWSRDKRVFVVPEAHVLHSHKRSPLSLFRRERQIYRILTQHGFVHRRMKLGLVRYLVRQLQQHGLREAFCCLGEELGQSLGSVEGAVSKDRH